MRNALERSSFSIDPLPVVVSNPVTSFYDKLSSEEYIDYPSQSLCFIRDYFCSQWELDFMVEICKAIPIAYEVGSHNFFVSQIARIAKDEIE